MEASPETKGKVWGIPPLREKRCVKFREMVYKTSPDILYILGHVFGSVIQRSTIVERWITGSSSRMSVLQ